MSQLARLGNPPLEAPSVAALAALDDSRWYMVSSEAQRLLWDALKDNLPSGASLEVVRELPLRTSDQITENERSLAVDLASRFVAGNSGPEPRDHRLAAQGGRGGRRAGPGHGREGRDDPPRGQVVTAADIEKLDLLGLRNPTTDWRQVGAAAAFAILTMSMLGAYIGAFCRTSPPATVASA